MCPIKGQSLAMWAVIFALVSASVIIFLSPVKRTIIAKTMQTTDHLLWGIWDDDVRQDGGKNVNQIGKATTVTVQVPNPGMTVSESAGKITTTNKYTTNTTSEYTSY